MAVKTYIPRIALIIDGKRYPVGEPVDLTDDQYAQVAAYVDVGTISDEDLAASGYQPDGVTPLDDGESDDEDDTAKKTSRRHSTKESPGTRKNHDSDFVREPAPKK